MDNYWKFWPLCSVYRHTVSWVPQVGALGESQTHQSTTTGGFISPEYGPELPELAFWLFNYVMMASYQWLCIGSYLIPKSYIKNIFDQETAYVCAMSTQKLMVKSCVIIPQGVLTKQGLKYITRQISIFNFVTR